MSLLKFWGLIIALWACVLGFMGAVVFIFGRFVLRIW